MAKTKPAGSPPTSLTIERTPFLTALAAVNKAVETRNTIPILANVLLSMDGERLTVRGTDLDIEITTSVAAQGSLPTTTAPAKTLLDIVKKFPAGAEVTMEMDGETLIVKSGRSRFKLAVIDAEAFPTLNAGTYTATFEVDLAALFAPVQFAISNEETRYYLNGIFLHDNGAELRAVATDGHRLARHSAAQVGEIPAVIVPKKTVGVIPDGVVSVSLSDTKLCISQGDTVIVSKLIEGTFPDYERVTPKNNDKFLTVDRAAFLAALDRVSVVANHSKAVRLDIAADALTLTVKDEGDSATDELAAEYASEPMSIGFNTTYLADVLRTATGETVTLALNEPGSPTLVKGGDENWLAVLMPMRVA